MDGQQVDSFDGLECSKPNENLCDMANYLGIMNYSNHMVLSLIVQISLKCNF